MRVFKKGQIFPRSLRKAVTGIKKAQHALVFGTDSVLYEGVFYMDPTEREALIRVPSGAGRKMKNGTRQKTDMAFVGISIWVPERLNLHYDPSPRETP